MGGKLLILAPVVLLVVFVLYFLLSYIFEQPLVIKDLKLSNLSDGSVSISYLTDTKVKTAVIASNENSFSFFDAVKAPRYYDDRDDLGLSNTHHVTVKGLTPGSVYYFRVLGNLRYAETTYPVVTTLATLDTLTTPAPSYGKFNKVAGASNDVILFYTLNESSLQSALLNEDLSVTLDKSNIRKADGTGLVGYKDGDEVKVSVVGSNSQTQSFTYKVGADQPFVTPELKVLSSSVKGVLNSSLVGEVSAACTPGRTYNEICGDCKSRKVTVTACSSTGNDAGWSVGNCDQTEPNCTPSATSTTTCGGGETFSNGKCVSIATGQPKVNQSPAPVVPTVAPTNGNALGLSGCPAGMPGVWTCYGNGRYKCDSGKTVSESCSYGCKSSDYGKDDVCAPQGAISPNLTSALTGPVDCTARSFMPDEDVIKCVGGTSNFTGCINNQRIYNGPDTKFKNYWIGCTGNSAENTSKRPDGTPCTNYNNAGTLECLSDATCVKDNNGDTNFILNVFTLKCELNKFKAKNEPCIASNGLSGFTGAGGGCLNDAKCRELNSGKASVYSKSDGNCVIDNTAKVGGACPDGGTYTSTFDCISKDICIKRNKSSLWDSDGENCVKSNLIAAKDPCYTLDDNGKQVPGVRSGDNCISEATCPLTAPGSKPYVYDRATNTCIEDKSITPGKACPSKYGLTGTVQSDGACLSADICKIMLNNSLATLSGTTCVMPNGVRDNTPCDKIDDKGKKVGSGTLSGVTCKSTPICQAEKGPSYVLDSAGNCVVSNLAIGVDPKKVPCVYEGKDKKDHSDGTKFGADCKGPSLCDGNETYNQVDGSCAKKNLGDGDSCSVSYKDGSTGTGRWYSGGCLDDRKCQENDKSPISKFVPGQGCVLKQTLLPNSIVSPTNAQASVLGVSDGAKPTGIKVSEPGTYTLGEIDGYTTSVKEVRVIDVSGDNGTLKFYTDSNQNGVKDDSEPYITDPIQVKLEKVQDNVTYKLVPGWNLISLNLVMKNITKASELLNQISAQDGYAVNISAYRAGQWITYTQRMGIALGKDFNLVPGEGYFVKSVKTSNLILDGKLVEMNTPIYISTGWNLIGLRTDLENASSLLKEMNKSANINVDTLTRYQSGRYDNVVLDGATVYGTDYNLEKESGYFLRAKKGGASWMKK